MKPKDASMPPPMIIDLAPNLSTSLPTIGPAILPSARARANISEVWALVSNRSSLIGPKKIALLKENIPPDNKPSVNTAA